MKICIFNMLVSLLLVGFSSNQTEAKKLNIVTTLPSLASIAKSIGGEQVSVSSITLGAQDPHYVDAKPSYMLKLNKADLLIYSGLELEIGWLPLLIEGARNEKVTVGSNGNLNASLALSSADILEKPKGEVDRTMGDIHPEGNPHYLLNPYNGIEVANLIAEKLIQLSPENKEYFESNLKQFSMMLSDKISEIEKKCINLNGREVICYHVQWSYLLDWLKIKSAGYIELRPGIPPTPKHKKAIIELAQAKKIKVIIISTWKDPTKAEEVANAVNAQLVILPGEVNAVEGNEDYIGWIDNLANALIHAFATGDTKGSQDIPGQTGEGRSE